MESANTNCFSRKSCWRRKTEQGLQMIKPTQDEMSFVHPLHEPLFLPVLLLLPSLGPSTLRELCLGLSLRNLETIRVGYYYVHTARFYTKDVWTNLCKHFVVRLVMRHWYKDGHKTHYVSRRTTFRSASFKTYFEGKFIQTHNASCARLYTWDT